ncbi:MAG: hypothetical protein ACTHLD_16955 [Chitinophaga sp.]
MDYSNIRALLEKYWACETTEAEEAELRVFYAAHEGPLPADLQEAAPLFKYFHAEGEQEETFTMPELFTDRPAPWETETGARVIRPFWYGWMKYAAVLLAAAGMVYSINQFQLKRHDVAQNTAFRDTYSDPKLAYEQTQRALQLLSRNLNKGKNEMEKLGYFNEAKEMVQGDHK